MDTVASTKFISVKILKRVILPAGALLLPGEYANVPDDLVPAITAGLDPFAVVAEPVMLDAPLKEDVKAVERSPRDTMQKRPDFHKGVS